MIFRFKVTGWEVADGIEERWRWLKMRSEPVLFNSRKISNEDLHALLLEATNNDGGQVGALIQRAMMGDDFVVVPDSE